MFVHCFFLATTKTPQWIRPLLYEYQLFSIYVIKEGYTVTMTLSTSDKPINWLSLLGNSQLFGLVSKWFVSALTLRNGSFIFRTIASLFIAIFNDS